METDPLLHGMIYKDGGLIIQKEGYYYVYSKVSFSDVFQHSVTFSNDKFIGNVTLLQSRKYSSASKESRSNSFLGGVFHLYAGDKIFVTVSSTSKIMLHRNSENFFGAFMI